jgi:hypothetical protein
MLMYVRALLLDTDGGDAGIDRVVGGLRAPPNKGKGAAEYMPAVPRACRGAPDGHDARTRRLVREVCAQNGELVEKARALRWLEDTFGAEGDITVDAMFEMHEGLGALAAVKQKGVLENVRKALARLEDASLTVAQRRRLEVVQERVAEVVGVVKAKDTGAAVYAHVAAKAKDNEPHGLDAHELGVAHTAFHVGPTVVYRAPLVEADAPAHGSWMGALLARLVPDRVQSVVDAASDAASGRKVQYRGCEPPGVGYALYALLPVLDHASAMCKAGAGEYAFVKKHTLSAIERLLNPSSVRG